ncbi:MAG TPA: prolyl oligopeptidase family serine peptidase [Candidatus Limnocylindrales bacterium]|nr:prolyl oligopeptidase family serine peptidase [Candidatus Limnocylindrales bacterium]
MVELTYPTPPTSNQADEYHGTTIPDPYRPLEDTDAPATRTWIAAENRLTDDLLERYPERTAIRRRLGELWNVPRAGVPWRRGDRWFQLRNSGLQDQDVLWSFDASAGGEGGPDLATGRPIFDPNRVAKGGTTAIAVVSGSDSGELLAVSLSEAGSDWQTWHVVRAATGETLPDRIEWSKFSSAAWTRDEAGFFYCRFPEPPAGADLDAYEAPNRNMELRYHRLWTDPSTDPLIFSTPEEPEWGYEPEVSANGSLLILTIWRGTDPENRVYVADLSDDVEATALRPLLDRADAAYWPIEAVGRTLYLRTDLEAPLGRVVAIDVDHPGEIREVIPEGEDALEFVELVDGRLALDRLHDAHHALSIAELDGRLVADVDLPGIGMIERMAGRPEDPELYVTWVTFTAPAAVLAIRMADGRVRQPEHPPLAWDPADYITEQAFATSKDGTRVPLFLTHRRDVQPTGDVPTLLYGYGGFQVAIGPIYKPEWLAWMERGGLLAVASLRGGAEYGKAWHDAGRLENKQNVFDDFAACAAWLAKHSGWTRRDRIGILGRSNGGLLVGASITQHPNLFGAAVAEVGVMDMLRFHRFTIGWGWTSDYGSADDPDQFRTLLSYSPLHNCRPGVKYPPTLVTTGDHDDRVVPGHSFKFAAALQAAQAGDAPILLRVDTDAGHGVGKPVSKLIDERADVIAFLEMELRAEKGGAP